MALHIKPYITSWFRQPEKPELKELKENWARDRSEGLSLGSMGEGLHPKTDSREVWKTRARRESQL